MTLEELLMNRALGHPARHGDHRQDQRRHHQQHADRALGQRGRIGSAAIKPRARAVAQALVPWFNAGEVDNLPAPLQMRAGESWTANLALPAPPPARSTEMALSVREQEARLRTELQRMAHQRHERTPLFLQR